MTASARFRGFPDDLRSETELGCVAGRERTTFRVFAPRATAVTVEIFERFADRRGARAAMTRATGGIWEHEAAGDLGGRWYGYRVAGPEGPGEMFDPGVLVADPYSRAVTTVNHWRLPAKTLIVRGGYDWEGVRGPAIADPARLVIYECHVRDMTAHPSSGARRPGTYAGFAERGIRGGIGHLVSLGVNAVELLPVMKFGTIELPWMDPAARSDQGRINDWNPYARNHWGYMTSFFFAPETWYGTDGTMEPGAVNGADGRAIGELKDLVKALHREGIAVILDVVYNHTSHYDFNPFKYIDKRYYYRCDESGRFLEESGCGNDFDTARPMARRLIVDSVRYWLEEFRVDGFRFDLAAMIDERTCREITRTAREIRDDAVLIAEPWGGGRHHPPWFSELGWLSWNDRFRDALKGRTPGDGRGFVAGGRGSAGRLAGILSGAPHAEDAPAPDARLTVNYAEAHDGHTLADFLRLSLAPPAAGGEADPAALGALLRFAALALFVSPGAVMIHEGQEFARRKIVAPEPGVEDPEAGRPDHNSYNKDNATNHLDYAQADREPGLLRYYRELIALRARHPRFAEPGFPGQFESAGAGGLLLVRRIGFAPDGGVTEGPPSPGGNRYIALLNASDVPARWELPPGVWVMLADSRSAGLEKEDRRASGTVEIPPRSGAILGES